MNISLGIIGGSGVYELPELKVIEEIKVNTPFGSPSSEIIIGEIDGHRACFLPRHGKHHQLTPSEVNYRANIFALKSLGVKNIVSVSAVGSLKEEFPPEKFVLPEQFIDWTKGKRERTFFGEGVVAHVSTAEPVNLELRERIAKLCLSENIDHAKGGAYLCIEGPQFSSKAESHIYRSFGADVIGMTNVPESYLAKEAAIAYATVAMVTDYDCWKEEHCTLEEIMKVMKNNNLNARKLMSKLVPDLVMKPVVVDENILFSILTPQARWTDQQKEMINVLAR
ncbi:MAG: S-methyl-5'-thioadenosine phosphorylase [Bdellovibrionales bacterium CG12_big_fil_rev_8_21_14_0_65_38_15]|nr:MAG: S-methyl-5'-thioadenosine phosphorylase [Bdellovibrionales bacterium CG22_combo_CG10-13_8_21_14_all_38_13]PIQ56031.1 MAG: S-methyl-5'-thioadenosine phosphorylase [Bdellovibrionales bacterium CG12_big_fil_rev_8_21_14_0_65_38_15]PIR30636.1 MAG: S-methyl-5'-thioadenosine phosphorylase [Bdellovibrionales bacterium CG11_big_fil_rev_8_21_14_0_20_38_13]